MWRPTHATISAEVPQSLTKSTATVNVDGFEAMALIDSGSSESFIHSGLVKSAALHVYPSSGTISMATSSLATNVSSYCLVGLVFGGRTYPRVRLSVLPELCADLILGLDFQTQHERVIFEYGGPKSSLSICGLSTLNISQSQLFSNLTDDYHPIATKSRKYSHQDSLFITAETRRLLKERIIEPSKSPWRAQVVVAKGDNHKRRMVVDYSQTINRFILLDAFPLPRISDQVNAIAQYRVFSTIDLRSAYHQVPLRNEERPYTAFEANNGLYQFTRVPFGVTNGVACFQWEMVEFVHKEH